MEWIVATKNKGKMKEIRAILDGTDITAVSMEKAGITADVVEDADTFEGNARKKATEIFRLTGKPCLADDSGLAVDALFGAPGVYSARYAGTGKDGDNNQKLLAEMKGKENRTARFVCVMVLVYGEGKEIVARGVCEGEIAQAPSGENGFGYDPLFYLPQFRKTMAELSDAEKNAVSHRGNALRNLRESIQTM